MCPLSLIQFWERICLVLLLDAHLTGNGWALVTNFYLHTHMCTHTHTHTHTHTFILPSSLSSVSHPHPPLPFLLFLPLFPRSFPSPFPLSPSPFHFPILLTLSLPLFFLPFFPLDLLWAVLCGSQPLPDAAHLHSKGGPDVPWKEEDRNATSHLLHLRQRLQRHAAG